MLLLRVTHTTRAFGQVADGAVLYTVLAQTKVVTHLKTKNIQEWHMHFVVYYLVIYSLNE